jgi:hypothetical protein
MRISPSFGGGMRFSGDHTLVGVFHGTTGLAASIVGGAVDAERAAATRRSHCGCDWCRALHRVFIIRGGGILRVSRLTARKLPCELDEISPCLPVTAEFVWFARIRGFAPTRRRTSRLSFALTPDVLEPMATDFGSPVSHCCYSTVWFHAFIVSSCHAYSTIKPLVSLVNVNHIFSRQPTMCSITHRCSSSDQIRRVLPAPLMALHSESKGRDAIAIGTEIA